ncbi:CLUMA_CG011974, isoform A [Clunio marinus]|uniref:CLUMA_CG011974, isoform A n=1 Tax=Clunio marinus TaxID=568069 RepID=A0A1J1IJR2_9DIPT|nr:CLUMA_CG011974, isoform A [Clunio marinus]
MKMREKLVACLLIAACFVCTTKSVPISSQDDKENSLESEIISNSTNGELSDVVEPEVVDPIEDVDKMPDIVEPEIVEPIIIEEVLGNSTDDESSEQAPGELRGSSKLIERNIIIENDNETHYYRGYVDSAANITTVIRLTNVINNTNIVNMPTTLNNTNVNNIHIYQNKTEKKSGKFGLGFTEAGSCCYAVEPKNCKQSTAGLKCQYKRRKVCGVQCTSEVIHPNRNPCGQSQQWPNIGCQPNQLPPSNLGFYPMPMYPPNYPGMYPQMPPSSEFELDDDFPMFPDDEELEDPEQGWIPGRSKCKIVSDNGLQITNCTDKNSEFDHPFARNTASEPIKRSARHSKHSPERQMNSQQYLYPYPVVYQPIYVQPLPVYIPQYYGQQPPSYDYYQQPEPLPLPPMVDREAYYEEHETNEIPSHKRHKKHGKKHRPVVIEFCASFGINQSLYEVSCINYHLSSQHIIVARYLNVTESAEYEDEVTTEAVDDDENHPPPGELTRPRPRPQYPNNDPNCNTNQPNYYPPNQLIIPVPPIINTTILPFEKDEIRLCPIGTFQNGSVCVQNYTNECPEGYTWKNDHCVLSKTICPLNFEWDGRSCVQYQICPHNHVFKHGRCVQPDPQCPTGFIWDGVTCQVADIICQPGSVLRGRECVIETFTCPPGFEANGDECIKPTPMCPPGFTIDESGFCVLTNIRCPQGSTLINGKCQQTVYSCPPDSYRHGNNCYKITTTDNTPTEPSLPCDPSGRPNQPNWSTDRPPCVPQVTNRPGDPILPCDPSRPPTDKTPCYPTVTTRRPTYPTINWIPTRPHRPHPRPPGHCPEGFTLHGKLCYRCPPNYHFCNMKCYKRPIDCVNDESVDADLSGFYPGGGLNINIFTSESRSGSDRGHNIVNHFEPINNTIFNINNVTHPVTLNNVNENNIHIYSDAECADGSIRTIVVKNNETINGCVDVSGKKPSDASTPNPNAESREDTDEDGESSGKCCEVVTPRQCKERRTNEWMCTHRRYKYCGDFCIADRLYLKPHSTTYHNNILTIAPSNPAEAPPLCFGRHCPTIDCSGCTDGSLNCSPHCYTYPCTHKGCTYLDRDKFCEVVGGPLCVDE